MCLVRTGRCPSNKKHESEGRGKKKLRPINLIIKITVQRKGSVTVKKSIHKEEEQNKSRIRKKRR